MKNIKVTVQVYGNKSINEEHFFSTLQGLTEWMSSNGFGEYQGQDKKYLNDEISKEIVSIEKLGVIQIP